MTAEFSSAQHANGGGDFKSWTGSDAAALQARVEDACAQALGFLDAMQADGEPRGVMRASPAHDPVEWPGMLLAGTVHGVMALRLLGGVLHLRGGERTDLVGWIERARRPNGTFAIAGMNENDVFKKPDRDETWRYIDFQTTNFALGAIEALEPLRQPQLDFVEPWLDPLILRAWLAERDMRDPLQEGNVLVNLGSFLLLKSRQGRAEEKAAAKAAFDCIVDWQARLQEPATGFWGVGQGLGATQMRDAMAGSTLACHLHYALRRPLPHLDRAVDYALSLSPPKMESAAVDAALVDLLVHAAMISPYRGGEVARYLARMLDALLDDQNVDGGFPDMRAGTRRHDGWQRGYAERQGLSNTYATWLRCTAIAMIADHFWPGWKAWGFRRMIGPGYRRESGR